MISSLGSRDGLGKEIANLAQVEDSLSTRISHVNQTTAISCDRKSWLPGSKRSFPNGCHRNVRGEANVRSPDT